MEATEEKVKAAMGMMQEMLAEYKKSIEYACYEESFLLAGGKVEGMERALEIINEVMQFDG